ncbi:extracellular solute-binding protein [Streptomyces sp. F001]|uniref:extracellular solute-binding protein n=1 Tax=Streptomyces sp. F001 TaxID=1510026 RepID=UPI001F0E071C|nr:extracellular solute-binding protein [Streptomyces sp. F001]
MACLRRNGNYYVIGYGGHLHVPTIDVISTEINFIGNLVGSYNDLSELMVLAARARSPCTPSATPRLLPAGPRRPGLRAVRGRAILIPDTAGAAHAQQTVPGPGRRRGRRGPDRHRVHRPEPGTAKAQGKAALFKPGSEISYQKYGKDYPATKVKDVPGPCSYEAISRKDYSGQTLKIISHAVPVIGEPTQLHAKQFEDITGGKVEVVNVPFGELHQKILTPLQAGQPAYDVMFYPSLWIGDMAPYLAPVPKKYLNTPGMKDVTKAYMDVATWDEKVVQYPVDGDRHYLKVRTDVLKDPKRQAEYKKATGKDLKVPRRGPSTSR